jgi:hypothetical protein
VPILHWRFIDRLLGRPRPGEDQPATEVDIRAEVRRHTELIASDRSITRHLGDSSAASLRTWAGMMLSRQAPAADGRTRREVNVQLGALSGAIRSVLSTVEEAFANSSDATGKELASQLRPLESEISSPLFEPGEQESARSRLQQLLYELDSSEAPVAPASTIARLVSVLSPIDN